MVKLTSVLSRLNPSKILVLGDMLLDSYTKGKARRISPEAPVPIVTVFHEEYLPGGAGNVILNLLSLGAQVIPIGRVAKDWGGEVFLNALKSENVDTRFIVEQPAYLTPVKNRIIVDNQQIVRVDREQIIPLSEALEQHIIDHLPVLLRDVQIVALSDYGKGFLTPTLLAAVILEARRQGIPVITDPKSSDFSKYRGTTLIKPNLSEVYAAANLPAGASLDQAASIVLAQCQAQFLMVTRSEAGISLFSDRGVRSDFPVQAKEVKDVTGAGDTVLAMLAHALANDLSYHEAIPLCNIAAGIAIEHVGCARVTLSDLAFRLVEQKISDKFFDEEHLFVLKEILKRRPYRILKLSEGSQFTTSLYQSIKQIADQGEPLLIYINEVKPDETLIEILSSLREVSFIVSQHENLSTLFECVPPAAVMSAF